MVGLAGIVVVASGVALIAFALWVALAPERAAAFLRRFASTLRAHLTEQLLRLAAGGAILLYAGEMWFSHLFRPFGWLLVLTSLGLMLLPWRWHRRFAGWATPLAIRHLRLYAFACLALGGAILFAALAPIAGRLMESLG